jgi:hypothetical protein
LLRSGYALIEEIRAASDELLDEVKEGAELLRGRTVAGAIH